MMKCYRPMQRILGPMAWVFLAGLLQDHAFSQETTLGTASTWESITKPPVESSVASSAIGTVQSDIYEFDPCAFKASGVALRLWPSDRQRKPGSYMHHFCRAFAFYTNISEAQRKEWSLYFEQADSERLSLQLDPLLKAIAPFRHVTNELQEASLCEVDGYDQRIRDLKGVEIISYLLPEVQSARDFGRLLVMQARSEILQGKFEDAISTIRSGYRLASFIRNGETLVEQLVGVAIAGLMQEVTLEAIATPNCPNLYLAIASVPLDASPMLRAIELEISSVERFFPVLIDAEKKQMDETGWSLEWKKSLLALSELRGVANEKDELQRMLMEVALFDRDALRQRLIANGYSPEMLGNMPGGQLLAIDTRDQLRELGNRKLLHLFEYSLGNRTVRDIRLPKSEVASAEQVSELAVLMSDSFSPAVLQGMMAHTRCTAKQYQLLILEAIRNHVATHEGKLPETLEAIQDLTAPNNPLTARPFEYSVTRESGKNVATLSPAIEYLPNRGAIRIRVREQR